MDTEIIDLMENDDLIGFKSYAQKNSNWKGTIFYDERFNLLHLAVCHNKPKFVKWILETGFDINARTKSGDTAVHLSVEAGALDCLKELLLHKPDLELEDHIEGTTALIKAIRSCQVVPSQILINSGASLKSHDKEKNTPIHLAIDLQQTTIIDLLLEKGVDIEAANNDGYNALHVACKRSDMVPSL